MIQYKIKTVSIFSFVSTFGILLILNVYFVIKVFGKLESQLLSTMVVIGTFLICYKIASKLTIGWVRLTMSKRGLEFIWIKKPLLTFQKNESVDFDKIESWRYRNEFQYSYLKIHEKSYTPITIMRFPNWDTSKDDFYSFLVAFEKRIERVNEKRQRSIISNNKGAQASKLNTLQENRENPRPRLVRDNEDEFFKSNLSKILLFFYVLVGLLGLYYIVNNWNTGKSNLLLLMYGVLGCVFYIKSHYQKVKKKE